MTKLGIQNRSHCHRGVQLWGSEFIYFFNYRSATIKPVRFRVQANFLRAHLSYDPNHEVHCGVISSACDILNTVNKYMFGLVSNVQSTMAVTSERNTFYQNTGIAQWLERRAHD